VKYYLGLLGGGGFLRGFEIIPRQCDDLALFAASQSEKSSTRINFVSRDLREAFLYNKGLFHTACKMAAFSRGLRFLIIRSAREESICSRCLFSTTAKVQSGHSRWSKIKHDRGKADVSKGSQRSMLSKDIAFASKSMYMSLRCLAYGTDLNCSVRGRSKFKSKASIVASNGEERYIMGYNAFDIHI
jgi:hypothetical protein